MMPLLPLLFQLVLREVSIPTELIRGSESPGSKTEIQWILQRQATQLPPLSNPASQRVSIDSGRSAQKQSLCFGNTQSGPRITVLLKKSYMLGLLTQPPMYSMYSSWYTNTCISLSYTYNIHPHTLTTHIRTDFPHPYSCHIHSAHTGVLTHYSTLSCRHTTVKRKETLGTISISLP